MQDSVKFTFNEIINLGSQLSEQLIKNKLLLCNELNISVDTISFHKIDEELFYRQELNKDETYVPSDNTIIIKFPYLTIYIHKS